MIGHLIAACSRGRRDAQSGSRSAWNAFNSGPARTAYADGYHRELAHMEREKRLPQLVLALGAPADDAQSPLQ